jgi:hypothetical protein
MDLRRKEARGTGGTCVVGKVPSTEFLYENDIEDTAPNITTLVWTVRIYGMTVPVSLKICIGQG